MIDKQWRWLFNLIIKNLRHSSGNLCDLIYSLKWSNINVIIILYVNVCKSEYQFHNIYIIYFILMINNC